MNALAPPPYAAYRGIISDFPWDFDTWSEAGQEKSASQHYDTMTIDEIIALYEVLNLEWICAPNCLHLLWTTWNRIADQTAHKVMKHYGFKPISGGAWFKKTVHGKDSFGNGYIFRDSCEPYLVGTRGNPGRPVLGQRNWRNGFAAKRGAHSEKPDYLHRAMEAMYPGGPYLELFARETRPGWVSWGNEVGLDPAKSRERREASRIGVPVELPPMFSKMGVL